MQPPPVKIASVVLASLTPLSLSLSVSVTLALPGSYALIDGGPDMDRQLTFFVFKFWPKPINSWAHRVPRGPRE